MIGARETFPLDLPSALEDGLERWRQAFFWPLAQGFYLDLEKSFYGLLERLFDRNSDSEVGQLVLAQCKVVTLLANFLYGLKLVQSLQAEGFSIRCHEPSGFYQALAEGNAPQEKKTTESSPVGQKGLRARMRSAGLTLLGLWDGYSRLGGTGGPVLVGLQRHSLAGLYSRRKSRRLCYVPAEDLLGSDHTGGGPVFQRAAGELCEALMEHARFVAKNEGIRIDGAHTAYLEQTVFDRLHRTGNLLFRAHRQMERRKPMEVIAPAIGNLLHRVVCLAVRGRGGAVVGCLHGSDMVQRYEVNYYQWLELPLLNRVVTHTRRTAELIDEVVRVTPPIGRSKVIAESAEDPTYLQMWKRACRAPIPREIRKVMLISYAYQGDRVLKWHEPDLQRLDWELRIIEALKEGGYQVLYKMHPEGVYPKNLFHFLDDVDVIDQRFEKVMHGADAFLFYQTSTSVFAPALCTNRPIVYINGGWEDWIPEVWDALRKRMRVVPARFDERNRLVFRKEDLLEALSEVPGDPDMDYLEHFVFPS